MFKSTILDRAIDITKEAMRGGNSANPGWLVEQAYNGIKKIAEEESVLRTDA